MWAVFFGLQILLSSSSPMQNVDGIKSHYLKGKQFLIVSVEEVLLAHMNFILHFLYGKPRKRGRNICSLLTSYLTSMENISLEHFRTFGILW